MNVTNSVFLHLDFGLCANVIDLDNLICEPDDYETFRNVSTRKQCLQHIYGISVGHPETSQSTVTFC